MRCKVKYPKFTLLILTFFAAYFIFSGRGLFGLEGAFVQLGYFGSFLLGCFYAYGFTGAPAAALFLAAPAGQNMALAAILGGLGALLGDLVIFSLIRTSFSDEIGKLRREGAVICAGKIMPGAIRKYAMPVIAAFIIASPLPDEIGVSLLAMSLKVRTASMCAISYVLNTLGIFFILYVGTAI